MSSKDKEQRPALQMIRNMGIFAHVDAGKTTATERILFYAGETHRIGDVDDANTVTDFMEQERERGITICSAAVTCRWDGRTINLIDTPGHVDFTMEVERSMRVLDGGVLVVCAKGGVQPQTRTVWRQANRHHVPRLVFINKMDTMGANWQRVMKSLGSELKSIEGTRAIALQIPMGEASEFRGVIDLMSGRALVWDDADTTGATFAAQDVPAEFAELVARQREAMVEAIAETDDTLLERYLGEQDITVEELKAALRRAVVAMKLVPVLCGSAFKSKGVQPLLDAIVDYLPSPLEVPAVTGQTPDGENVERKTRDSESLAALVFKVVSEVHGNLFYTRVYSGTIRAGSYVFNSGRNVKERVSRIVRMQGDKRRQVQELAAGDIGVLIGLKASVTGDTLCDETGPILLESIVSPEPVISQAVEAKTSAGSSKLAQALNRLGSEDPSFKVRTDSETGQVLIAGQGELHLEIMVDRMKREDGVEVTVGKPQVAYRETVRASAVGIGDFKRQTGGRGMYANVKIELVPAPTGSGFEFEDAIVGGAIPREFISSVEKGIREALQNGPLSGSPVTDVKVRLVDGKYHEVDSNDTAFRVAGGMAFRDAFPKARPVLLEPVMKIDVEVPESFMGGVLGDIPQRRGRVNGQDMHDGVAIVHGVVPLSRTFGYSTYLRNASQGEGTFTLEFANYEPVPDDVAEEVLSAAGR